ncbi:MAG: transglycosylase domain-containing protein, partial [Burkholderiaceae bacterium]|nr:transglycosylase domain-containing protein [Burkholderiaceae bacterium]
MKKRMNRSWLKKTMKALFITGVACVCMGVSLGLVIFSVVYHQLPALDVLTDYRPKIPLRVYTADGDLIGEFGEERRDYVPIDEMPRHMRLAILAAEDNGFYEHSGIEFMGIARAAIINLITGRRGQGGSTITMQVA